MIMVRSGAEVPAVASAMTSAPITDERGRFDLQLVSAGRSNLITPFSLSSVSTWAAGVVFHPEVDIALFNKMPGRKSRDRKSNTIASGSQKIDSGIHCHINNISPTDVAWVDSTFLFLCFFSPPSLSFAKRSIIPSRPSF